MTYSRLLYSLALVHVKIPQSSTNTNTKTSGRIWVAVIFGAFVSESDEKVSQFCRCWRFFIRRPRSHLSHLIVSFFLCHRPRDREFHEPWSDDNLWPSIHTLVLPACLFTAEIGSDKVCWRLWRDFQGERQWESTWSNVTRYRSNRVRIKERKVEFVHSHWML